MIRHFTLLLAAALTLSGCLSTAPTRKSAGGTGYGASRQAAAVPLQDGAKRKEVVMYAFGLISVDYRFGGANPESGLDCSGMVSYIFHNSVGLKLPHNAAQIARLGKDVAPADLRPGDLVFFNTQNRPFPHVGVYISEDKFIHAPSTNGQIKVESMKSRYFASRFEAARTFFN